MNESRADSSTHTSSNDAVKLGKTLSLWTRRCHLYLGLFLAPWAFLYGITGYLFNHPTHFSDRGLKEISRATLVQSGFDGRLPDPQKAAKEVVEKLNERFPEAKLVLASDSGAKWLGDFYFATASGKDKTYQLLIRRDGGGGTYLDSTVPRKPTGPKADFVINPRSAPNVASVSSNPEAEKKTPEPLRITQGSASRIEKILPELAKRLDTPGLDVPFRLTSAPQLQFRATSGGNPWMIKYDSFQGGVTAEWLDPASPNEPMSWRSYLLRLHTTHGYSGIYETRWFWAMIVDAMSFVMVFWAMSGLLMWWQIRRLRKSGWVVIAMSLLLASVLFYGMAKQIGA